MTTHQYVATSEVRRIAGTAASDSYTDEFYQQAVDTATEMIDEFCGRRFDQVLEDQRIYEVDLDYFGGRYPSMSVGDVLPSSLDDVVVEYARDPNPSATWTAIDKSEYWFGPNPLKEGRPYTEFFVKSQWRIQNQHIRITADWGWDEVPAPIVRAALILAVRSLKREDSPMGQLGTSNEQTGIFVRRVDPDIQNWIRPYRREYLRS